MTAIHIGKIYQHYKGKKYLVTSLAKHSESLEDLVVYVALYESPISQVWVRPLSEFLDTVNLDGTEIPRFSCLS